MAQRHNVQNPQRRGKIWYWRPRLPVSLFKSDLNRKLSYNLKQSDHHLARYLARRLNAMLPELRCRRDLTTQRRESLKCLVKTEIDHGTTHSI